MSLDETLLKLNTLKDSLQEFDENLVLRTPSILFAQITSTRTQNYKGNEDKIIRK